MFRSTPPSGQVRRLLTIAALLCSAVVALPASAAAPTEAPPQPPEIDVVVPATVEGSDAFELTMAAPAAAVLIVTDAEETVSTWALDPAAANDDGVFSVDLTTPDEGAQPVNGPATVVVTIADVEALSAAVLLDRSPAAPSVTAKPTKRGVALNWTSAGGPGDIVYRVQRTVEGRWVTVRRDLRHSAFLDTNLDPGWYRYRVTALAPAADSGFNASAAGLVSVRIAGSRTQPPEPAPPTPTPPAPATGPEPEPRAELEPQPSPARNVAVTGDISRPVQEPRVRRQRIAAPDFSKLQTTYEFGSQAQAPAIAEQSTPAAGAQPAPSVALPRIQPLPAPVAPVGMLAVEASNGLRGLQVGDAATLVSAALLSVAFGVRRRRQAGGGRSPVNT